MFSRFKYGAATLATIIAAYFLYALIAVPLIEPSIKFRKSKANAARPSARPRKLDHLFAPGSWELDRPKIVETDQGTLYFDDYKPLSDGRLELTRCTVIYYAGHASSLSPLPGNESVRRPFVLRAPQGATLNFDRTLNVIRGEFGHLIGGRLEGEITISSPPSEPGRDDALSIITRNVQLDARRIWTPHEVHFRYGPNVGTGRDLTIYLAGSKPKQGEPSLGVGGVKLLELVHLDRLDLQLNDGGLFGERAAKGPTARVAQATDKRSARDSVTITCRGPLRLDLYQHVLSLEDHVDLMRHNDNGPSDQLLCQLLEIHFADTSKLPGQTNASQHKQGPPEKLTPTKVVATGYPVIIRAASAGVGTRAERLEYDCILRRIWLKDRDKVMFHNQQHEIEAKELMYTLGNQGRVGDLVAAGPGTMRGTVGTPSRSMAVEWKDKVVVRRIDHRPVVSFTSQVRITLELAGVFSADTLHLYLNEKPKDDGSDKVLLEPDRMHAIGRVDIQSANLTAKLQEAKLWFRAPAEPSNAADQSAGSPGMNPSGNLAFDLKSSVPNSPKTVQKRFDIDGQLVEALVVLGKQPVVDRLVLRGKFELREVSAGAPQPLVVRGDLFELQEGASDHPRGALLGKPAEVASRGMLVHGERFHVYPADNVLDIVGPGDAVFPSKPKVGDKLPSVQLGKVNWKKQMHFDGEIVSFEGNVAVNVTRPTRDGEMRGVALGDVLRSRLTRRVDFQQPQIEGSVELEELAFEGWGFFEMELLDLEGQKKLSQQMQVRQLTINHTTGEIRGQGPGWLRGIHRGRDVVGNESTPTALPLSTSGLNFLRVDFANTLTGNLQHRQLEFLQGTKTLYGPVNSWNDSLDQFAQRELPPKVVVLTCDRLAVAQMAPEADDDQIELEATGNAHVEGNAFSATGGRISYAKAKDQLILEGDGRNAATLAFQKQLGDPPWDISADKIMFRPGTRHFEVIKLRSSNIFDVGQLRGNGSPANKPR